MVRTASSRRGFRGVMRHVVTQMASVWFWLLSGKTPGSEFYWAGVASPPTGFTHVCSSSSVWLLTCRTSVTLAATLLTNWLNPEKGLHLSRWHRQSADRHRLRPGEEAVWSECVKVVFCRFYSSDWGTYEAGGGLSSSWSLQTNDGMMMMMMMMEKKNNKNRNKLKLEHETIRDVENTSCWSPSDHFQSDGFNN